MSLILYVIGRGLESADGDRGVHDAPLRLVREGDLVAVVSELDGVPDADKDLMWEYEAVIERLSTEPVLPARFGSLFADEASVRAMLSERCDELVAALWQVAGAVEFAVSAGWLSDGDGDKRDGPPQPGTEYLMGRLERQRRARDVVERLDPLAELARSMRHRVLPRTALPVSAAYLVDDERSREFADLVAHLGEELEDIELVCTGPWPPYTFALGEPA